MDFGTPTNSAPLNREDLRIFLRDFAQNNVLLDNVQFTADELTRAIAFASDEWNIFTPVTRDMPGSIPRSILMLGAAAWLMQSESFLQLRNQATYQDGDVVNIGIDDKHQFYLNLAQTLKAEWKATAQKYKQQLNMEDGYGSIGSGYRYVGRRTGA